MVLIFRAIGEVKPEEIRGFFIEAYREIYRAALDISDYSTAIKALQRIERTVEQNRI